MADDPNFWTAVSAVIVAFITGVGAPYIAARYKQKANNSPAELVKVASQGGFGNGTARMAIQLAHEAQAEANKSEEEKDAVIEENKQLRIRVRKLEDRIRRLREQKKVEP